MNIFKFFRNLLAPNPPQRPVHHATVQCRRCGEIITTRIDLKHDLSLLDDGGYVVHKTLMGEQRCFERIEVSLYFDSQRNLIDRTITRGSFVNPTEDEAA